VNQQAIIQGTPSKTTSDWQGVEGRPASFVRAGLFDYHLMVAVMVGGDASIPSVDGHVSQAGSQSWTRLLRKLEISGFCLPRGYE